MTRAARYATELNQVTTALERANQPIAQSYKGVPRCQAKPGHDDSRERIIMESSSQYRSSVGGVEHRARCGLAKRQPVIDAASMLQNLMKDAPGAKAGHKAS